MYLRFKFIVSSANILWRCWKLCGLPFWTRKSCELLFRFRRIIRCHVGNRYAIKSLILVCGWAIKGFSVIWGHKHITFSTYFVNSLTTGTLTSDERPAEHPSQSTVSPAFPSDVGRSFRCPVRHLHRLDCRTSPYWLPPLCIDKQLATFDCTKWCRRRSKACSVQSDPSIASTASRMRQRPGWDMNNPCFTFDWESLKLRGFKYPILSVRGSLIYFEAWLDWIFSFIAFINN